MHETLYLYQFRLQNIILKRVFVKLQSKVQTSVLGLGVDFVSPLLQQQEEQQEQEPSPKSSRRRCTRILKFDTLTTQGLLAVVWTQNSVFYTNFLILL